MKNKVFLLLLLFPIITHAEGLSFSVGDKIYSSREEINLDFILNSCTQEFKARPTVDVGLVEIYNPKTLIWVSQNNSWEAFPYIEGKIKIRVAGVVDKKVLLGLELQNVKLGTVTKSKGVGLWISDAYKNYIDVLNAGIVAETLPSAW